MSKKSNKKADNIAKTRYDAVCRILAYLVDQGLVRCGFEDGDTTIASEEADKVLLEIGRGTYILYSELVLGVRPTALLEDEPQEENEDGSDPA